MKTIFFSGWNMKTALITGASRGIGAAIAKKLAEAGYAVALNYSKDEKNIAALAGELKIITDVAVVRADVSSSTEVETMFAEVEMKLGEVDLLVNNAGISQVGLLTDVSDEQWSRMIGVNLSGTFYCCRRAIPAMVRKHAGRIINISSMWGITGASCEAAYSATKAGVIGLTKALAAELGPSNITVNCIAPGCIATDMMKEFSDEDVEALKGEIPLGRIGTPEDVAGVAVFLASDAADYLTGQVIGPNGGMVI